MSVHLFVKSIKDTDSSDVVNCMQELYMYSEEIDIKGRLCRPLDILYTFIHQKTCFFYAKP